MLVVLESLSPLERTVFVLREVFGYSDAEIAEILATSQLFVNWRLERGTISRRADHASTAIQACGGR